MDDGGWDDDGWDDELLSKIDDIESLHLRAAAERQAVQQQQQLQQQQHPQPHHDAHAQWACKSCTLLNAATRTTCSVCSTPRGHTFDATQASTTHASAAAPQSVTTARKTVQATLPFAPPPRQPAQQPVPAPPTNSFWQPQQQQQSHTPQRRQQQQHAPTASGGVRSRQPVPSPPPPLSSSQFNPPATTIRNDGDSTNRQQPQHQSMWPIAYASQHELPPRRSGEDPQAKTRYLDVLNRAQYPAIDYEAAQQFVYPTNYAVRAYQLTIAERALYHNTLVSLPTGLGKTLIASVVMYNYYRWFPRGKIVFMAPTKPLVAQQIEACHEIMGIPLRDTAELQGNVPPARRKTLWRDKRVFFCTPQSMQNDLRHGICAAEAIVCLVVDEAHRATGNYAYCCVVNDVARRTPFFRVLALSATPGAKFDVIQDVIANLRISHIESRSADDADVKQYTHARQEEVIKCTLSAQITDVKALFLQLFDRITTRLVAGGIIQHKDPEKLTRWYVLQMREKFRQSDAYASNRAAESDLALLVSLLHAKELLTVHGLSSFHEYVNGWIEERERGARLSWAKKEMMTSSEFHNLVMRLNALNTGASGASSTSSHPKLLKLREVLHEHFGRHATGGSSTRAIVFTQYRSSVTEIVALLAPLAPLLQVQAFVGQGSSGKAKESKGQSQKQQQEIVRAFRAGECNVLVATCIAEEGLDIGEVDLIVSFDALTSPVRMIQRMGRTGRKRVGRVVILVTEGDEEKKLARSVASAKTVSRALTTFKSKFVYAKCPRMLPTGICPTLSKLEMTIPAFHASQVGGKSHVRGGGAAGETAQQRQRQRWQLSDIERSIAMARYVPHDFSTRPRAAIFPVVTRSRSLLRSVQVTLRHGGRERVASDTFQIGHSSQSVVLRQLVRSVHGVSDCDDEVVDVGGDDIDGDDDNGSLVVVNQRAQAAATTTMQPTNRSDGHAGTATTASVTQTDTQSHIAHDFSYSATDESTERVGLDTSFGSPGGQHRHQQANQHFSPDWADMVSPSAHSMKTTMTTTIATTSTTTTAMSAPAETGSSSSVQQSSASVPTTTLPDAAVPRAPSAPVASVVTSDVAMAAREPRLEVPSTASTSATLKRSPNRKPLASASVMSSPSGRRVRTALSSPSPKRGVKKDKAKRSSADVFGKESTGGDNSDVSELVRGERLLERLRDLVVEAEAEAAVSPRLLCSPEQDTRNSQSGGGTATAAAVAVGSQTTKVTRAPLPSFPRITRRLDFDAAMNHFSAAKRSAAGVNCVPAPPSLTDGVFSAPPPPHPPPQPSEALPDDDEDDVPVFTLLQQQVPPPPEDDDGDAPAFTLLPALREWTADVEIAVDAAQPSMPVNDETLSAIPDAPSLVVSSATAEAAMTEPDKRKRSLALRRAVEDASVALVGSTLTSANDTATNSEVVNAVVTNADSSSSHVHVPSPPMNFEVKYVATAGTTSTIETTSTTGTTGTPPVAAAKSVTVPAKRVAVVIELDDFDDFDDAPLARMSAKRQPHAAPSVAATSTRTAIVPAAAATITADSSQPRSSLQSQQRTSDDGVTQSDCCGVCTEVESYEDDPIVYCDGCELGVHQFCYGIVTVPTGSWYCDSCTAVRTAAATLAHTSPYFATATKPLTAAATPRCALCPVRGGALKPTLCGRWAHVQCFMWLPELQLALNCDELTLGSLARLDPDRTTLVCELCRSQQGHGIIQCAHKRCLAAFHVSCAAAAHYALVQDEPAHGDTLFLAYCPLHARRRQQQEQQQQEQQQQEQQTPIATPGPVPQQQQQQQTPAKTPQSASGQRHLSTAASPSAMLFSPTDHDSAKKFRKFRRLKRKYDASQQSQSPAGTTAPVAATAARESSTLPSSTPLWSKRIKRSQQHSEGRRRRMAAVARMFIEDDVEVQGDHDDDDDDDDGSSDDVADAFDDSFINDSSQLLYSPVSPQLSGDATSASSSRKRKRASPGDMRAIYARSLLESQHDLPMFMRHGQRDLPQHGIIHACLQELRSGDGQQQQQSPASSMASTVSPAPPLIRGTGVRSRDAVQSPISLLSPEPPRTNSNSAMTTTPDVQRRLEPACDVLEGDDDDNVELRAVAPPSFSLLLPPGTRSTMSATATTDSVIAAASSVRGESELIGSSMDDDHSLHERIEANRRRALEKLRERQLKLAQTHARGVATAAALPQSSASHHAGTSHQPLAVPLMAAARSSSSADVPTSTVELSEHATASQDNAVPEPPSFSLFPTFAGASPGLLPNTSAAASDDRTLRQPQPTPQPQIAPQLQPRASPVQVASSAPPVRTPQLVVYASASCSRSSLVAALAASRALDVAVDVDERLEADMLLSVRVAVVAMSHHEFVAALARSDGNVTTHSPRLRACASVFKRVLVVVRSADAANAAALGNSAALERLRQSSANIDAVIDATDEQLSRHLLTTARQESDAGFGFVKPQRRGGTKSNSSNVSDDAGLDRDFHARFAYFRSLAPLTLGSALSLSFRFQGFAVAQMPVHKFNEMHWKRMLPWLSDVVAKQLPDHVRARAS